ncbi:alanine aminotransferase 2 like protein [Danaus plexippus plexippus]|uniref:alanine transaminase n=1 Tax=Danaus plexippus plexippus TaxID=278856 RepID=A0A212FM43_DANPL|nr:alanine aminotransferase 2-like [Danaus plexippus plexippus]OWR54812.1 alanine aminotransferase 2 like protein [Danaus plexippus plexippus]
MASMTIQNLSPNILQMEYAIQGPVVARAGEIEEELKKGVKKPFKNVIRANIGDAQAMGQPPITFIRQMIACIAYPKLIEEGNFPEDVRKRAKEFLQGCSGGTIGSYSIPHGLGHIRRRVAEYIELRDGVPADWKNVYLSAGATVAIQYCLQLFSDRSNGRKNGILTPVPTYPFYSACYSIFGINLVGYYLDEDSNWDTKIEELERSLVEAQNTCNVRALLVINPGNPTGQVLSRKNIEEIIKFAYKHNLFIIADEVSQDNVYSGGKRFYSFRKVMIELGAPYSSIELVSFTSVSKGYMGESGLRGGWLELNNIQPDVQAQLFKYISAMGTPNVIGQAVIDCVVKPPSPGEPSYDLWLREKTAVLESLNARARLVSESLNAIEGYKCNVVQGALYAFPRINLPPKAVAAAEEANQLPDVFYAYRLLEETGICVVPGSGFGQVPGTYHYRTTILPEYDQLRTILETIRTFHQRFIAQYT